MHFERSTDRKPKQNNKKRTRNKKKQIDRIRRSRESKTHKLLIEKRKRELPENQLAHFNNE